MSEFRQSINRVLNAHGFTAATTLKFATKQDTLTLGLQAKTQNGAERTIRNALFLLTDKRGFDWKEPFLFGSTLVWLIDFDQRLKNPWICIDSNSTLHHLSTNAMIRYAVEDNMAPAPEPTISSEERAKQFAVWG